MNFLFFVLPKIINDKRLELFEFRQVQHLLENMFYYPFNFESKKIQEKLGLVLVVWRCYGQKWPNLANFFLSAILQVPKLHQQ
jgi:hypothetical protein